ncbi:hypothetical protein REMIM1_PC00004 (plasmid) [Rhizobium etli bv. mimosae str. Mim1]|nr:hypothetical protein REMIM1_PC00004 [Rhizobium etli bv. mimosae str. Mim1]
MPQVDSTELKLRTYGEYRRPRRRTSKPGLEVYVIGQRREKGPGGRSNRGLNGG